MEEMAEADQFQARAQAMARATSGSDAGGDGMDTGDAYYDEDEGVQLLGNPSQLALRLMMLGPKKAPKVPDKVATPVPPPHSVKAPASLIMPPKKETAFDRTINSTCGRVTTFALTIFCFIYSAIGLINVQEPVAKMNGDHYPTLALTFLSLVLLYACLPMMSEKSGMHPRSTGWKPYMVMYRCAYIVSVPALGCLALGYGAKTSFGDAAGGAGAIPVALLPPKSGFYFEASDGFVALNLTIGVTETLKRTEHGEGGGLRRSRFRDAELLINKEPYTGYVEPTVPPGALKMYVVAPIFNVWALCISKYRVSATCLGRNTIVGWAYAKTETVCSDLSMVACRASTPELNPVYQCSRDGGIPGKAATDPISGLCGRIVLPPREEVIDELSALLLAGGWPEESMPNSSQPWVDVSPDDCISDPKTCTSNWDLLGLLGMLLSAIVVLCIIIPAVIDWKIDRQIREVRDYWERKNGFM